MSILSTSPVNTRHFDMEIATALGSFEAAIILQQLHYWTQKEGIGVMVDKAKYVYNSYKDWVKQQFTFLTEWKFRKAMSLLRSLSIVKVIRHKAKEWNQTNYYSLNYSKLREWAGSVGFSVGIFSPKTRRARSIEISELCNSTPQDEKSPTLEVMNTKVSLYEPKITTKKESTKQRSDRLTTELNHTAMRSESFRAAADVKNALEEEERQKQSNHHSEGLTAESGQNKAQSSQIKLENQEEGNVAKVDYIVNAECAVRQAPEFNSGEPDRKNWEKLIPELDGAGIPINKTVKSLLKLYPKEKVEEAIALLRARKREKHIPNVAGYFVSALKGEWGSKSLVESGETEVDKAAIFRHWYDLARELGYCSGQEIREGSQWICLSGAWEKWEEAVSRGYSLEYLKKIMKRNQGR
jgi:hypothetical protein